MKRFTSSIGWCLLALLLVATFRGTTGVCSGQATNLRTAPIGMTLYSWAIDDSRRQDMVIESGAQVVLATLAYRTRQGLSGSNELKQFEKFVDRMRGAGIEVIMQIKTGRADFKKGRRFSSEAPRDWKAYEDWIGMVAKQFKGKIRAYLFEDEAYGPHRWNSPVEDYIRLLETSSSVIQKIDPDAGISPCTIATGIIVEQEIRDLLGNGKEEEALRVFSGTLKQRHKGDPAANINTADRLRNYMSRGASDYQRRLKFTTLLLSKPGMFDLFEVHNYSSPDKVQSAAEMTLRMLRRHNISATLIFKTCPTLKQHKNLGASPGSGRYSTKDVDYRAIAADTIDMLRAASECKGVDYVLHYWFPHPVTGLVDGKPPYKKRPVFRTFQEFIRSR